MPACDEATKPSALLEYLPTIYQGNEFLGRFLRVFEDLHQPLKAQAAALPAYFDPAVAPPSVVKFLASWVGADIPSASSLDANQRALVRNAIAIWRWRGTKRGLADAIRFATGQSCTVQDGSDGLALGDTRELGAAARLGSAEPFAVSIRFDCLSDDVDRSALDSALAAYGPAHVRCEIVFRDD